MVNLSAYFGRIGYSGPMEASAESLRELHRKHMFTVPFENLDIHLVGQFSAMKLVFYTRSLMSGVAGSATSLMGRLPLSCEH